jgi:predicted DNA-binding protein with PD1-like motif
MENYTFRLKPGQDLFDSIESFVHEKHIGAGCVLSGVAEDSGYDELVIHNT